MANLAAATRQSLGLTGSSACGSEPKPAKFTKVGVAQVGAKLRTQCPCIAPPNQWIDQRHTTHQISPVPGGLRPKKTGSGSLTFQRHIEGVASTSLGVGRKRISQRDSGQWSIGPSAVVRHSRTGSAYSALLNRIAGRDVTHPVSSVGA